MEPQVFASDVCLPQMLHMLTIRSPVAKGRLISVEAPELPEGFALIGAGDIPGENRLWDSSLPVLACGELSYAGEPVALLLGPDRAALEEFAEGCKVIAEEGEPVFSAEEAEARAGIDPGIVAARREFTVGDPDGAFARAASVVRHDYETGIQDHWLSEPRAAVAWIEPPEPAGEPAEDGERGEGGGQPGPRLAARLATQWPLHARRSIARVLGLDESAIAVLPCAAGAHLDGRLLHSSLVACHAALGALITGRPARLMLSKKEDFLFSPKRFGAGMRIAGALDEKGALVGAEIRASINVGACAAGAEEMLDQVCLGSLGVYALKNLRFKGAAFRTNLPPQGPLAGFGIAQGAFAIERHASITADGLGRDPAEWRKENFIKGAALPAGLPLECAIPGERLIDAALAMSGYPRKWAAYELLRQKKERQPQGELRRAEALCGIGIALGWQGSGLLRPAQSGCAVELILEKDGSLEIKTSMADVGHGAAWADIAADILAVDARAVRVSSCGEGSPDSGPATMSRKATAITELVEQACLAIRGQRFRDPLPISVTKTAEPAESAEWNARFPTARGGGVDRAGFLRPGSAAAVVEVEAGSVEPEPRIRGVWLAVDGGRIFRGDRARRALRLSVAQSLGWAYKERVGYAGGRIPGGCFDDFEILGAVEMPPVEIGFIPSDSEHPKGVGDLPFACVPAAYLQAVSQALDRRLLSIPLKARDVWLGGAAGPGGGDAQ